MWSYWINKWFNWAFWHIYTCIVIDIQTKSGKEDGRWKMEKTNDKEDLNVILHLPLRVTIALHSKTASCSTALSKVGRENSQGLNHKG